VLKAALFDMDGLMIDTERLHHESFKAVLEQYGITPVPNKQGVIHISGISAEDNWGRFKRQYGLEEDVDILSQKKNDLHYQFLKDKVTAMPGLLGLLKMLRANKFEIAIASSSIRPHIDLVIKTLGISDYIGAIASGDEVTHCKPAPDIFLKAASKLGTLADECVVFEDAMNGMRAAKAANMKVVVVPNSFTSHEDFGLADKIAPSLEGIDIAMLSSL
jgi:beta-phosphoglucomutase family hydrolase